MKKTIKVAAAIIENTENEILCALRSPQMTIPNHWEFPGGKLEKDETLKAAIEREIYEELNCTVELTSVFHNNIHEYDNFIVNLITVKCRLVAGTPIAHEHAKLIWMRRESLLSLVWAPADVPAVMLLVAKKV